MADLEERVSDEEVGRLRLKDFVPLEGFLGYLSRTNRVLSYHCSTSTSDYIAVAQVGLGFYNLLFVASALAAAWQVTQYFMNN